MEKQIQFQAFIKRKIFWRKRQVTLNKNILSYEKQDTKYQRSFDLNKYDISISTLNLKEKNKTEFIISLDNQIKQTELKIKFDNYEQMVQILNHFQKNNLRIASQTKKSCSNSEMDFQEIGTPKRQQKKKLEDYFQTNDLKQNEDEIGAKINQIKEQIHQDKFLFYGNEFETIHLFIQNDYFNSVLSSIASTTRIFVFFCSFIYQYNTFVKFITAIILFNYFNYLCQNFYYFIPIIIFLGYILNQTKAKIKLYLKKPLMQNEFNDCHQEFMQITKDVLQSNINKIFNEQIKDTAIQIKHVYQQNFMMPTEEVYFLLIQQDNIDTYLKIKSGAQSFNIEYYGKFRLQVRQNLQIIKYKIENKLRNFSLNIKSYQQQNLSTDSKNFQNNQTQKKSVFSINVETVNTKENLFQQRKRFSVDDIAKNQEEQKQNQIDDNNSQDSLNFYQIPSYYNLNQKIKFYSSLNYVNFVFSEVYKEYKNDMEQKWDLIEQKDQVYSIYKLDNKDYLMRKTIQNIKCSLDFFQKIIFKPNLLSKYNKLVKFANIEQKLNENIFVQRLAVKCPFPITDRDYLDYVIFKKIGEKKSIILMTKAPDELCQKQRGYVRAVNAYATHEIEEIDTNLIKVTSCTKSDAKMQVIPKSIIEMGAKNVGKIPLQMKDYVECEFTKYQ